MSTTVDPGYIDLVVVPEPSTLVLLGAGSGGVDLRCVAAAEKLALRGGDARVSGFAGASLSPRRRTLAEPVAHGGWPSTPPVGLSPG